MNGESRPKAAPDDHAESTTPDEPIVTLERVVGEALAIAGVPPRYLSCRLESFSARGGTAPALETARGLVAADDVESRSLVLTGPPGVGKTHLATGILAGVLERRAARDLERASADVVGRRILARWVAIPALLEQLRRQARGLEVGDPMRELVDASLLVLDDVGAERLTDWTLDRLSSIVTARYDLRRGVIVTSNLSLDELADRGMDRIVSRALDDGPAVRMEAPDYRLERQAAA